MQRYLRPDLLDAAGIEVFDTWAATFGQVVTQVELAPEGGDSFRIKSRFARFANVPEMLRMWHVFADVKTADDLDLPVPALAARPTGAAHPKPSPSSRPRSCSATCATSATGPRQVRNRAVGPEEDNMLKVSGDGRRAALDLRLVGLPQTTPGKIAAAADRIAAIWQPTATTSTWHPTAARTRCAGRCSWCSATWAPPDPDGTPTTSSATSSPPAGCPARRSGSSTRPRPTRTWPGCSPPAAPARRRPGRLDREDGRRHQRPGPRHRPAPPRRPVAARRRRPARRPHHPPGQPQPRSPGHPLRHRASFDGYMWQTLERKARFIHQVMPGRLDTREIGDIGDTALSFSEAKALATGNPLLIDKAEADAALARLHRAERAHHRNQDALRHADHPATKPTSPARPQLADDIDTAIARRQDTRGEEFTMTVDGTQHRKRADAGQHAKHILDREAAALTGQLRRAATIGHLGGFPVTAELSRALGATNVTITLDGAPGATIEMPASGLPDADPAGLVTRLENRLTHLETRKAKRSPKSTTPAARSTTPAPASASRSRTPPNSPPPASAPGKSTRHSTAWRSSNRIMPRQPARRPAAPTAVSKPKPSGPGR